MTHVVPLRPEPPSITSLSFVQDYWVRDPGKRQGRNFRCFWSVRPSGDWGADNDLGDRLALEWLEYAQACLTHGCAAAGNLNLIASDMPPGGDGVTVGFWSIVGYAAAHGAPEGINLAAFWGSSREAGA